MCAGDCDGDERVAVEELILAVRIAVEGAPPDQCASLDADASGSVEVAELVVAVGNALQGCGAGPTATPPPLSPTPSATPTVTATPAVGPGILFFGLTSADDILQPPSGTSPEGVPIYTRQFGFGFRLVVEARRGTAGADPGVDAFAGDGLPDLQVQVTRPLGNGSSAVCDVEPPLFGGVPAIDPPRFDESAAVVDTLNDFGCRFVDGSGEPRARTCSSSCVRFEDAEYACVAGRDVEVQFCGLMDAPLEFPAGETLVTVRVRDVAGNLGAPAQLIVRVLP